jgi:hypothetical protein
MQEIRPRNELCSANASPADTYALAVPCVFKPSHLQRIPFNSILFNSTPYTVKIIHEFIAAEAKHLKKKPRSFKQEDVWVDSLYGVLR